MKGELRRGQSDASYKAGSVTHTLTYLERVPGDKVVASPAARKPPRFEEEVRLELQHGDATSVFGRSRLTVYEFDPVGHRINMRLAGGELAGWIAVRSKGSSFAVRAQMEIAGHTTEECRRSYTFLRQLLNEGGSFNIIGSQGPIPLLFRPGADRFGDPDLERLLDDLGCIEKEFGITFTLSTPVTEADEDAISFLATAIRERTIALPAGEMTITLVPSATKESVEALTTGSEIRLDTIEELAIFGQTLPPIRHKTTFVSPRLIEGSADAILRKLADGHDVHVRLSVAEIIHTFPQWEPRAA
jgi:hypothetical protein